MTKRDWDLICDGIIQTIKGALSQPTATIKNLEARIVALEAEPRVKFCGTWRAGTTYMPGDAATHHGSLWLCTTMTTGEPSKDFAGWQLAVKRGAA